MRIGRILFLDAYDSFSNNITALLRNKLPVDVETIKIHDRRFIADDDAFTDYLQYFDAVIAGPGPGHPAESRDVGLIGKLWHLPDDRLRPILGICLGFQSLAHAFGAAVQRLREPRHGLVTPVTHCGRDIFSEIDTIRATQYHSLHISLYEGDHQSAPNDGLWIPGGDAGQLIPLAWDLSDSENGKVLMAVRHSRKPFWGVQYHPESVCTSVEGRSTIGSWWQKVLDYNRKSLPRILPHLVNHDLDIRRTAQTQRRSAKPTKEVRWSCLPLRQKCDVSRLVESLRKDHEPVIFESGSRDGRPINPETGCFTIIGLQDQSSSQVRWSLEDRLLIYTADGESHFYHNSTISDTFGFIQSLSENKKAQGGPLEVPFWGGLVGFISYEAGLGTVDVEVVKPPCKRPDLWFVFVDRSIVIDHIKDIVYFQSIRKADQKWLQAVKEKLQKLLITNATMPFERAWPAAEVTIIQEPKKQEYCRKVRECQSHLRAGSSYELCLTDQTVVQSQVKPWSLYQNMRRTNPAPFGVYLALKDGDHALNLCGSSPERFLCWTREGLCQYRPIKGTVKKTPDVDLTRATELLSTIKERAENLMIVDLVRHDLNGVPGVRDVCVPKLMSVEEYETVFQLVSVIEGDAGPGNGIQALGRSLPPGSMTGAPKKRSCELLQQIEGSARPRGVYSGVVGYLDVGGGGDFAVVIRSAVKWGKEGDIWHIGAGGAVTALSDAEAEWLEMLAKRERVLQSFN